MINKVAELLAGKRILILGFGKEGISTYGLLIRCIPPHLITISDQDEFLVSRIDFVIHPECRVLLGKDYLETINDFEIIIKAPGISALLLKKLKDQSKITSQTELFLRLFANRTIGVTGTKGKSTTSSLISHILLSHFKNVLLVGNIGIPPFDLMEKIGEDTLIVFELSSHQLEHITVSPHIAVILNMYEEHLDHYESYYDYQLAKFNITKFQSEKDWLILNSENTVLTELYDNSDINRNLLTFSINRKTESGTFVNEKNEIIYSYKDKQSIFNFHERKYLPGEHNLMNIMAAICVSKVLEVPDKLIDKSIHSFKGLRHRMEYVGRFNGIDFYNDSISTIPQSTIQAVRSLKRVDTLILGGKDRGIDYRPLIDFLPDSGVRNLIFTGEAGKRIQNGLLENKTTISQNFFFIHNFNEISDIVRNNTVPGFICLLSPAASSYDIFRNFEERGEVFKKLAENL
jgi:UDP-N-acetylmuramoylalanine--D-glutamate ligase